MWTQSIVLLLILFAPYQAEKVSFRMITVQTERAATDLRARILAGESFDALAREHSKDASASDRGFMGTFAPSDLRQELRSALSGLAPRQISPVLRMGSEFFLVQVVDPGEVSWIAENAAAMASLQKGRHAEAVQSFSKAVQLAEKFGANDDRLGESLNGLAEAYRLQDNFAGVASVSRRMLSIRWSASSNMGDAAVADLVDRFADVLSLAYFRGGPLDQALKRYQDALIKTPANEALYLAMSSLLVKAELTAEADDVMRRAVTAFPASRRVRYKEAEMYRDSGKMQKALETFQAASQMKAPPSMPADLDRLQLSFIYQRMGGINTDLVQFDAAIAAYKKAVEISPDNADARVALGDVYLRRGQQVEALAEYTRVLQAHPDRALPHYRFADANLQMGRFSEAAASAERALKIDPKERKARYVRGMALLRMGRAEEGRKELEEYRNQEAAAQTELNDRRAVLVSNRGASVLVLEGKNEEAVAAFRKSLASHPGASSLRLNLGLALSMAGRNREAITTLQAMIDGGISDDFVVFRCLAREYAAIKDDPTSQKYSALYLSKIDEALEQELR